MTGTFGNLIVHFFRNYLQNEKGVSGHTLTSYATCIKRLLQFCCERLQVSFDKLDVRAIDHEVVLAFLDYLETRWHNAPETRNQRLAALKTFFRFLALQDPTLTDHCDRICAIEAKATEHKVVETLLLEEVQAMVNATDPTNQYGARDQAMFTLFYNTGARVQELVDLDVSDLKLGKLPQITLTGKGRKERVLPLRKETVQALQHYLAMREAQGIVHEALFLNTRGQRLTRYGVNYLVKKYRKPAAEKCPSLAAKRVTPHTFRHTTALHMIQSGVDITGVKEWLGHAHIKTASLYVDINIEMKRHALDKCKGPKPQPTTPEPQPEWLAPDALKFLDELAREK